MSSARSPTSVNAVPYTKDELNSLIKLSKELRMVKDGVHPTSLFMSVHKLPVSFAASQLPARTRNDAALMKYMENFLHCEEERECTLKRCTARSKGFFAIIVCFLVELLFDLVRLD